MQHRRPSRSYTPEALADIRHRYEDTDEPQWSIAADYGIHRRTLSKLAHDQGWKLRTERPPRDVPPDLRALIDAGLAAPAQPGTARSQDERSDIRDEGSRISRSSCGLQPEAAAPDDNNNDPPDTAVPDIEVARRLERYVAQQLDALDTTKAQLGPLHSAADGERIARSLARLTDTLIKARKMCAPATSTAGIDDDDHYPRDIDAFRNALAARIEALGRSWTDEDYAEPAAGTDGGGVR